MSYSQEVFSSQIPLDFSMPWSDNYGKWSKERIDEIAEQIATGSTVPETGEVP